MPGLRAARIGPAGRGQQGLTLLEVLVALTVLAIGALGLLSLARTATGQQQEAIFRLRAVAAAADLADRVRANPAGAAAYAGPAAEGGCSSASLPAAACDPATLAADDLFRWRAGHLRGLPEGAAVVTYTADTAPPSLDIEIRWRSRTRRHALSRRLHP